MFDLTKQVRLDSDWQKKYAIFRTLLYVFSFALIIYVALIVLFPVRYFDFFFKSAGALKNTVTSPRNQEGVLMKDGKVTGDKLIFDTSLAGDFSVIDIDFILEKNSSPIQGASLSARKSFQVFLYPEGEPMGFKEGSLVKNSDNYFIVSGGKFRKFAFIELLDAMDYNLEAFIEITEDEMTFNELGDEIELSSRYPNSTLFRIGNNYYQNVENTLFRFVSEKAFLTQYASEMAVEKDAEFLDNFNISGDFFGFSDGTLLSSGESAFIVSQGKLLPINNVVTFESMGFSWDDVIPADGEEIGIYKKQKLFTIRQPHPSGVIFRDMDSGKHYLIQQGLKREIIGENILKSYLRKNALLAEKKGLEMKSSCNLKKSIGFSKKFSCKMSIDDINMLLGNNYQFELNAPQNTTIKELNIAFKNNKNFKNMKFALGDIKNRIKLNYGLQE